MYRGLSKSHLKKAINSASRNNALYSIKKRDISNSTIAAVVVGGLLLGIGKWVNDIPSRHKASNIVSDPGKSSEAAANDSAKAGKAGSGWMSGWFVRNFYDGGFEDKMSKREAALILGVRESSTVERIKASHRRVMLLNHPDKGGSVYLTSKINEAKELLLKGRE